MNAASFTPKPRIIATADITTMSSGISDSVISAKSKLPTLNPIAKNHNNNTTAPTCVKKKKINAILSLAPSPYHAIRKKDGINMTSKKI